MTKRGEEGRLWPLYVRGALIALDLWRKAPLLRGMWRVLRDRLHLSAMIGVQELLIAARPFLRGGAEQIRKNPGQMVDICMGIKSVAADLLLVDRTQVNVTIKTLTKIDGHDRVETVGRSKTTIERPQYNGNEFAYEPSKNSATAAILGLDDGKTHWRRRHVAFSCNRLRDHKRYVNMRPGWETYYESTLVLPIPSCGGEIIGFLTLDSGSKDGFADLPNIYKFNTPEVAADMEKYVLWAGNCSVYTVAVLAAAMVGCAMSEIAGTEHDN